MKKVISVFICVIMVLSLCACGAKGNVPGAEQTAAASPEAGPVKMYSNDMLTGEQSSVDDAAGVQSDLTFNLGAVENRKIIYEAHLRLEAIDFDAALTSILKQLDQLGGYVSSSSVEGQKGVNSRYADYVFRIPQNNYNTFLNEITESTNVLSQSQNAQDISAEYVDIEARLKSLKTQEERLLEMMKSAGELETLLAVQNQLADVQYRIESITAQKNTYDKLTQYATVNITLEEVYRITETQKDTFWQKIGIAFRESWINFSDGLQEFIIVLIYFLPALIVFAIIAGTALFIAIKAAKKRKKAYGSLPQNIPVQDKKSEE